MLPLKSSRTAMDSELAESRYRPFALPMVFALWKTLRPCLDRAATGDLLDAGCGVMPYRRYLEGRIGSYTSLDVEARSAGVTYLADVQHMPEVPSASYDTVLCAEVLEHLPRPEAALAEIYRVLRPGGRLIVSVPFLARLHEEPRDYFRFTAHGLRELCGRTGFVVEEITPTASVLTFLGHQLSSVVVAGTWGIPGLRQLAFALNLVLIVLPCYWIDRLIMPAAKLPVGYVLLARRRSGPMTPTGVR